MTTAVNTKRAVIYARVSTREQEEDGSIETQLDYISHDAVVNEMYDLNEDRASWYLDEAESGSKKWVNFC